MDVVWLKRDVRLQDHGPLSAVSLSPNPVLILYLFEPDQLCESSVHGSHLAFIHEGLLDLEATLSTGAMASSPTQLPPAQRSAQTSAQEKAPARMTSCPNHDNAFKYITVCYNDAVEALDAFHTCEGYPPIKRLFAHEETGHWKSYMRDRAVRRWCKTNRVPFLEFSQTGVTRCLQDRDHFSQRLNRFLSQPLHATPNVRNLRPKIIQVRRSQHATMQNFQTTTTTSPIAPTVIRLCPKRLHWDTFDAVPAAHRTDRPKRSQEGGEKLALATLRSFLMHRGAGYSPGISSPNTSWTTCSRLSTYLSWGHISLRKVLAALRQRQAEIRAHQSNARVFFDSRWERSLGAFASRIHWRSHFLQKLESEPMLEKRDLCAAYQPLRRQEGDWNEAHYQAWSTGKTGFPFVDACMRCLVQTGWLNFRMRAMLVSFATHNLWLDWKRIAPHLARVFLDFEPGIHYPQLQMQAGTTGINAMRVYSVTKQAKEQDPNGEFIRRYVSELSNAPPKYIHEPWRMPLIVQQECNITICKSPLQPAKSNVGSVDVFDCNNGEGTNSCAIRLARTAPIRSYYPRPIVDEKKTAKLAKDRLAAIRKMDQTKIMAAGVYQKHGSRSSRRDQMNGCKPKTLSAVVEHDDPTKQHKITALFARKTDVKAMPLQCDLEQHHSDQSAAAVLDASKAPARADETRQRVIPIGIYRGKRPAPRGPMPSQNKRAKTDQDDMAAADGWNCLACTFRNMKQLALACEICGTHRYGNKS